ncbi:MAG: hypothetical protein A2145_06870 [candidate division Zixibacteria bacterium RBG_16_40_9]|nr:MAG: hypothetical protein A2145_06870 [candidate division Zixibacteria bacterium RBG_16_40_9]
MEQVSLEIIVILLLILANGFFALSEIALVAARKSKIRQLAKRGNKKAQIAQKLQEDPNRFLATVQIGITLVGTLAGVIGGARIVAVLTPAIAKIPIQWVQKSSEEIAIGIVVISISYLSLVIGELLPKYIAILHSEKVAMQVAGPVNLLSKIISILVTPASVTTKFLFKLLGGKEEPLEKIYTASEEEIKLLVQEAREKGTIEKHEEEYIHSIFRFTDKSVKEVMTPLSEIVALDINSDQEKLIRTVTEEGYSRIPIYERSIDNIIGIIHTKDIINILQYQDLIILNDIIRKPYFIRENKKISELLKEFQRNRVHMAVVQDQFGKTAGLITLEDILEEIVGEIHDEHDMERAKEVDLLLDGTALVNANMRVDDFNQVFQTQLPLKDSDTVGSLIVNKLGRIPASDETVQLFGWNFTVYEKLGHRLQRLKVSKT